MSREALSHSAETPSWQHQALTDFADLARKHDLRPVPLITGPRYPHHQADRPANGLVGFVYILRPPITAKRYGYAEPQPGLAFDDQGRLFTFEAPTPVKHGTLTLRSDCSHEGIQPEEFDELWFASVVAAAEDNLQAQPATYGDWACQPQNSGIIVPSVTSA